MGKLDRYLNRQALTSVFVVVTALLVMISLFALFEELDENDAAYGFSEAVIYVLQTLPRRLDEILTYGLFLGYLIALGRCAENNELTICRVSGMSPARIMLSLAPSMLLWLIFSTLISEFVAPVNERAASAMKIQAQRGGETLKRGGLWLRTGNIFMQVQAIDDNQNIHDIVQYRTDGEGLLLATLTAKRGHYDSRRAEWIFHQGVLVTHTDSRTSETTFRTQRWPTQVTPQVLSSQAFLEPGKMSMQDLRYQIQFAASENLDSVEYELALWSRLLKPLTFFGLILFALASVIGPLREVGMGVRLTVGIFAGLGFKYLQDLFAPAAMVFNIPAVVAILIPIAVYTTTALYLIRRSA